MNATEITINAAARALTAITAAAPNGADGALFLALCAEQWQAMTRAERRMFDGVRDFAAAVAIAALAARRA